MNGCSQSQVAVRVSNHYRNVPEPQKLDLTLWSGRCVRMTVLGLGDRCFVPRDDCFHACGFISDETCLSSLCLLVFTRLV